MSILSYKKYKVKTKEYRYYRIYNMADGNQQKQKA